MGILIWIILFAICIVLIYVGVRGEEIRLKELTKIAIQEYEAEKAAMAELEKINAELDELEEELNNHKP